MPKKKTVKKSVKTAPKKVNKTNASSSSYRTLSFWIGVITLTILAFVFFYYTRDNNYKQALSAPSSNQSIYSE